MVPNFLTYFVQPLIQRAFPERKRTQWPPPSPDGLDMSGQAKGGKASIGSSSNRGILQVWWFSFPVKERGNFIKVNAVTQRVKLRGKGYISNTKAQPCQFVNFLPPSSKAISTGQPNTNIGDSRNVRKRRFFLVDIKYL